ncbi:ATP-binding protein [Luteimonas sp. SX5]|uniref:histidine kinase n=1 Tax=Luteimonas galliterrae TaxID=2940486 RepID=A0ABT0MJD3_9GAMM|nr:ATP-binding protein [Luteimonas galliterrae]MCL1634723.1 ATP-binding protein [Luteimonas galliterrae]
MLADDVSHSDGSRVMELRGYPRLIAILLITASVLFIGASYWQYGLKAQAFLQLSHMIPLLFAGLMLGRPAVWLTAAASVGAILIGAAADFRSAAAGWSENLTNLTQPALACLLIALILDRLIAKSDHGRQRSLDLDLVCDELEAEIRAKEQKQAQLIHSQKMDALGQLAGGIAHDFNNLLSVILGYSTDPMNVVSPRQAADNLGKIEKAARRGSEVIRRLLSLSRSPGLAVTFEAGAVLNELAPLVRSLFNKRTRVLLDLPDRPFLVRMDRHEFELAILNIAGNARDAMPEDGTFKLAIDRQGTRVTVRLTDTGHGMAPEVSARIFEPFYTTKPEGIGTGIGMAVVYQSITEAGGTVKVESSAADGTTILIDLPDAGQETHPTPATISGRPSFSR